MANEKQAGGAERGGSGNFANDPQRASEAGKKGGEHSHGGGSQQQGGSQSGSGGSRSGSGNFANDRDKASEAGKKGARNLKAEDDKNLKIGTGRAATNALLRSRECRLYVLPYRLDGKSERCGPRLRPETSRSCGRFGCRSAPSKDSELSPSHVQ